MLEAITELLGALNQLGIRFYAGGSVASSIHGVARFTQDLDLVADIPPSRLGELAAMPSPRFYADEEQMRQGLRFGRSFKVIHLASGFKVDLYPLPNDEFHRSELARASPRRWIIDPAYSVELPVASPEDTLLSKLESYRRGGEASDRQWADILGVARTQRLDYLYMEEWAGQLGVASLLQRLRAECG